MCLGNISLFQTVTTKLIQTCCSQWLVVVIEHWSMAKPLCICKMFTHSQTDTALCWEISGTFINHKWLALKWWCRIFGFHRGIWLCLHKVLIERLHRLSIMLQLMVHLLFQQDNRAVGQLHNNFNLTVTQNGISQQTVNSLGPNYIPHQLSPGSPPKPAS